MHIHEALALVIELAEQNVIDDPDMRDQRRKQRKAISMVSSLAHATAPRT